MSTANHTITAASLLEPLLSAAELAEYLGVPVGTVYDWRSHGRGPTAHRFGKHLKFALSDVTVWMAEHREDAARTVLRNPQHRAATLDSGAAR